MSADIRNYIRLVEAMVDEMAVRNLTLAGKPLTKPGSFDPTDRKILQSPKAIEKIRKRFAGTPVDFDFVMVNSGSLKGQGEQGAMAPDDVAKLTGLTLDALGIQDNDDVITVVFTGNSGQEKYQFSPWLMAHRIGHAFAASARPAAPKNSVGPAWAAAVKEMMYWIHDILQSVYGQTRSLPYFEINTSKANPYIALARAIGTMKSARDNDLRTFFEFIYELFAQWLTTGAIKLNPLPETIRVNRNPRTWDFLRTTWSAEDLAEEGQHYLIGLADNVANHFASCLESARGKILLM